jgi:hypothetical protein
VVLFIPGLGAGSHAASQLFFTPQPSNPWDACVLITILFASTKEAGLLVLDVAAVDFWAAMTDAKRLLKGSKLRELLTAGIGVGTRVKPRPSLRTGLAGLPHPALQLVFS